MHFGNRRTEGGVNFAGDCSEFGGEIHGLRTKFRGKNRVKILWRFPKFTEDIIPYTDMTSKRTPQRKPKTTRAGHWTYH